MNPFPILLSALWQGTGPAATTPYLILGYIVMWLIGTAYVVTLITRQRNLNQDVQLMRRLLEEDEDQADA